MLRTKPSSLTECSSPAAAPSACSASQRNRRPPARRRGASEEPAASVARELEEETGYRAGRVLPLGVYRPNPAHFTNRVHAFVALDCEAVHDGMPDHGEDLTIEVVPRSAVAGLARDGRITHALILATLHLATLKGYL